MSWTKPFSVLVLTMAVAACGAEPEPGDVDPNQQADQELKRPKNAPATPSDPAAPSAVIRFTSAEPVGEILASNDFPLHGTLAVHVVVEWSGVPAGSVQRLDLLKPSGLLYASAAATIPADGRTVYTLQIAGTPVESYEMTGTWVALARLEGDREPLSASAWTLY